MNLDELDQAFTGESFTTTEVVAALIVLAFGLVLAFVVGRIAERWWGRPDRQAEQLAKIGARVLRWAIVLQLPDEELLPQVTPLGSAFAMPGETTSTVVDFGSEGDYFIVCFIPVSTTPEALAEAEATGEEPAEEGPPHFTVGMLTDFVVG